MKDHKVIEQKKTNKPKFVTQDLRVINCRWIVYVGGGGVELK